MMFKKFFTIQKLLPNKFCQQVTLEEKSGVRCHLVKHVSKIIPSHYISEETRLSRLKKLGSSKSLKLLKQKLPENKRARSGELGEILATEYTNCEMEYKVPIKKLRWKDSREQPMRGDDFIGVINNEGNPLKILKGEAKSRNKLTSSHTDKLMKQLRENKGRPKTHSMLFIAERLRELGDIHLAEKIEGTVTKEGIKTENIEHLGFTFSGNCSKDIHLEILKKYKGKIKLTLAGVQIEEHQDFIHKVYQEAIREEPTKIANTKIQNESMSLQLESLIKPEFRDKLLAKGLARLMIWQNGELPENGPKFPTTLTEDLLDYGYALFLATLKKIESKNDKHLLKKAFLIAGESIESVVRKGDPSDSYRGYHTIASATAFHLAGYSARSYCIIQKKDPKVPLNISHIEQGLIYLLTKDLNTLSNWIKEVFDNDILFGNRCETSNDDLIQQFAIEENFLSAMAYLELALKTGESSLKEVAISKLNEGISISKDFCHVPLWWENFVAKFLIQYLWNSTLHKIIPQKNNLEWQKLRRLFISLLYISEKAEVDLWPSQIEAGKRCFDEKDDLVVTLPTSSGKTRIAEMCILRTLSLKNRIIYVTPLRALSAQTERTLSATFTPLDFTVSSLYGAIGLTGDDTDTLKNKDIVVSTPEKLGFALRNDPEILDDVGLVIFDEGHMLDSDARGINYEILIQKILKRKDSNNRRIVCLSAMFPQGEEFNEFVGWIRQDEQGDPIQSEWRPTRQRFGIVKWMRDHVRLDLEVGSEKPFVSCKASR